MRAWALAGGLLCGLSAYAQTAASAAPAVSMAKPSTAASGGAGKVWVNTSSHTYHCADSKFYGKTKIGEYMTEADAKSKGNKALKGKVCAK